MRRKLPRTEMDGADLSAFAKGEPSTFPGDYFDSPMSANILGDCPICGAALTPAIVTAHRYDTNQETGRWERLVCSKDITHVMPSDSPGYTPPTTDKAT